MENSIHVELGQSVDCLLVSLQSCPTTSAKSFPESKYYSETNRREHFNGCFSELVIETFVQAFPPVNIDVLDAAFTQVFVLVVCLGILACCLCRSVTVIVTT